MGSDLVQDFQAYESHNANSHFQSNMNLHSKKKKKKPPKDPQTYQSIVLPHTVNQCSLHMAF